MEDWIGIIIALLVCVGYVGCEIKIQDECKQKSCPSGMSPTYLHREVKCMCVIEPK